MDVTCLLCSHVFDSRTHEQACVDGLSVVRCPKCGLVQRALLPTADELPRLYDSAYFTAAGDDLGAAGYLDYLADAELHRVNARRRLRRLAEHVEPADLLDVGCAAGFFVDEAQRAGWTARGIDISEAMVAWGVDHLGVELVAGQLSSESGDGRFRCVTMWDYLEHSRDPLGDVEAAFRLLEPGGVLALSTGDVGSALARVSLRKWHLMTPRHHLAFFSRRTMRLLLRSAGFETLYVGAPASVYPLRYLAHKSRLLLDVSPTRAVARGLDDSRLGAAALPVNLFDVMTVVARRPVARAAPT